MTENQLREVTAQSRPGMLLLWRSDTCAEIGGWDTWQVKGMQDRPGESMDSNVDASLRTWGWGAGGHSVQFAHSVQFSHSVTSNSLRPHEPQHTCPSPTPRVHPDPCPSSRWCHPAISSSVGPFSSWPQSLPASGSFPMSQLFTWGGQSIGVSASASVLPMKLRTDLL